MMQLRNPKTYQPEIQGLRCIAVLLVIYYHSGLPGFPGGYIGVDVFFVISGYLITGLLLHEANKHGTISLARFYARRFQRLLPAAVLVLLATTATAWFVYSPLALKQYSSSAFATAVYVSNGWFAHLSTDYLAEDTDANPLLHTWSLGVEEQFYIVWPLLILIMFRSARGNNSDRRMQMVFLGILVASLFGSIALTRVNQPWAFFSSPTRAWEFATGAMITLWFRNGRRLSKNTAVMAGWLGLACVLVSAVFYTRATPFPGTAAILPVLGTALMIASIHSAQTHQLRQMLSTPAMQQIGDMSYSLYLWHWPIFVYWQLLSNEVTTIDKLTSIALVFILSWLTLKLLENPIRYSTKLSMQTSTSLAMGIGLTAISATVALGVRAISADNLQQPMQKSIMAAKHDRPRIYKDNCHLDYTTTRPIVCNYGHPNSEILVVLFGDSHAAHWFPALEAIALKRNWRLLPMTKSGCPSIEFEPFDKKLGRAYIECSEWRENVVDMIKTLRPHLTVLSNASHYMKNFEVGEKEKWQLSLSLTLEKISGFSRQVAVIQDTPWLKRDAPDCLSHAFWQGLDPSESCTFTLGKQGGGPIFSAQSSSTAQFQNAYTVDMTSAICSQAECSVYEKGIIKFSDSHHLTKQFSKSLAWQLDKKLGESR